MYYSTVFFLSGCPRTCTCVVTTRVHVRSLSRWPLACSPSLAWHSSASIPTLVLIRQRNLTFTHTFVPGRLHSNSAGHIARGLELSLVAEYSAASVHVAWACLHHHCSPRVHNSSWRLSPAAPIYRSPRGLASPPHRSVRAQLTTLTGLSIRALPQSRGN